MRLHTLRRTLWLLLVLLGCQDAQPAQRQAEAASAPADALALVLAAHEGTHAIDERIRRLQQRIPNSRVQAEELERLGWTFIARARELGDPGGYQLALQSALAIEASQPHSHAAALLRGHALQSLHHFAEAEQVARRLVAERGLSFDFGLLGDVLVDRGALDEATQNYQRMMDIRPDSQAYTRAAHVRYLRGDLSAALEAMRVAARAVSPRNRETFAWTWAKLAGYQLQAGDRDSALDSVRRALEIMPDSYHAQRMAAQIFWVKAQPEAAVEALRAAAARSPHPEALWMLSETLERQGLGAQAAEVRAQLTATGAREDPRTYALYLATTGQQLEAAERLARDELGQRADVFSYETLAWVQLARGEVEAALFNARHSLVDGSSDPRLYYHAGMIAQRAGEADLARGWLERARSGADMLLPSQREALAGQNERRESERSARRLEPNHRKGSDEP
ncbi:MAG TPA: hypothetical protein VJV78_13100 [Polyangiales bacterium]|nr:hypothetical protein [Polyangiales bacterium]